MRVSAHCCSPKLNTEEISRPARVQVIGMGLTESEALIAAVDLQLEGLNWQWRGMPLGLSDRVVPHRMLASLTPIRQPSSC